jgi:hypothetical protein
MVADRFSVSWMVHAGCVCATSRAPFRDETGLLAAPCQGNPE